MILKFRTGLPLKRTADGRFQAVQFGERPFRSGISTAVTGIKWIDHQTGSAFRVIVTDSTEVYIETYDNNAGRGNPFYYYNGFIWKTLEFRTSTNLTPNPFNINLFLRNRADRVDPTLMGRDMRTEWEAVNLVDYNNLPGQTRTISAEGLE